MLLIIATRDTPCDGSNSKLLVLLLTGVFVLILAATLGKAGSKVAVKKTEKLTPTQKLTANPAKQESVNAIHNGKVTSVRFLKVHKAGSTTMQNLLFRFGVRHDLNIVLTTRGGTSLRSAAKMLKLPPGQQYHILALHTKYSKAFFSRVIPGTSAVNIGIVRYPLDRVISAAYYHRDVFHVKYLMRIPKENFIHNLINYPEKYDSKFYSQTRNLMGQEFGFSKSYRPKDHVKIKNYLGYLNSEFRLVLIMEKFDESLVLLKRLLHWDPVDIIYKKKTIHHHQSTSLNSSEVQKVRQTCFLDFAIYDYFTGVFEEKVNKQGPDFKLEVEDFKRILTKVHSFCDNKKQTSLKIEKSRWYNEFTLTKNGCNFMNLGERQFISLLKKRHYNRMKNATIVL